TSEWFLDEDIGRWPGLSHEGNGMNTYVDVEAVRAAKPYGLEYLLKEAWDRAQKINSKGIPVCGVTAWSLLGAFDWNTLLTSESHIYEPGVFDIRCNTPRPTAMSSLIKSLAHKEKYDHPLLRQQGWWHHSFKNFKPNINNHHANPLIIIGSNGTLGNAFKK